jgi:hypothetical protein
VPGHLREGLFGLFNPAVFVLGSVTVEIVEDVPEFCADNFRILP